MSHVQQQRRGPGQGGDPFFGDFGNPFQMMEQMMGNMDRMMGSMFNDPFFSGLQQHEQHPLPMLPSLQDRGRNAPMIEEVHDDGYAPSDHTVSRGPIVEEPDDSPPRRRRNREELQQTGGAAFTPFGTSSGTYGFCSSSFMSNQNGVTYQKSATARMGPGGVKEYQSTLRDGRTGKESITVSRGLGDRARTITRTRDASGKETAQDQLKGIQQDEANRFDQEWMHTAQQNLYPVAGRSTQWPGHTQPQRQYSLPAPTLRPGRDDRLDALPAASNTGLKGGSHLGQSTGSRSFASRTKDTGRMSHA